MGVHTLQPARFVHQQRTCWQSFDLFQCHFRFLPFIDLIVLRDLQGKLLRAWSRDGEKGRLFDGVSNIRIDGRVAHFELGQIPEHAIEMRAAANFLVANYGRQKIITMPRSVPKIAIFEEAARTLEIPGGVRMIQEYYRQIGKDVSKAKGAGWLYAA